MLLPLLLLLQVLILVLLPHLQTVVGLGHQ
jgi:hypothetical protein